MALPAFLRKAALAISAVIFCAYADKNKKYGFIANGYFCKKSYFIIIISILFRACKCLQKCVISRLYNNQNADTKKYTF